MPRNINKKRFVRYKEGAELYSMCQRKFEQMAKIGRPKKDFPKIKSITIRLSDSEYEKFIKYAASHNMTMTQALVKGIELLYQNP